MAFVRGVMQRSGGQGHGAVAVGDGVLRPLPGGELLLELFRDVRGGEGALFDDLHGRRPGFVGQDHFLEESLVGFGGDGARRDDGIPAQDGKQFL